MSFYRKKPVTIEARLWSGSNWHEMLEWVKWEGGYEVWVEGESNSLVIQTLEGDHSASPGDMIIKGVAGEYYPCKPEIFAETYEPVEEATQ